MPGEKSEMDSWWTAHFFEPFTRFKTVVGPIYQFSPPPKKYGEARVFARQLWTCCDDEDMRTLVCNQREGAAQFKFLVSVFAVERLLKSHKPPPGSRPVSHKPFFVLASVALDWMDEVENQTPGKTTTRAD